MRSHLARRARWIVVILVIGGVVSYDRALQAQGKFSLPAAPAMGQALKTVEKGHTVVLGPFEIITGDDFNAETYTDLVTNGIEVDRRYWFQSPRGTVR